MKILFKCGVFSRDLSRLSSSRAKLSALCEQTLHYNDKKLPENVKRSIKHRLDIVT